MAGLVFDWEKIKGTPVTAFLAIEERQMNDGSLSWRALAFVVGESAVLLTVDQNSDEIEVTHAPVPAGPEWKPVVTLAAFVGRPLGWSWTGTNYRGYDDVFIIAFGDVVPDALEPRLMFISAGSALSCSDLTPR